MKGWRGRRLYERRTINVSKEVWSLRYNVARNPIGMVPNAPLASDTVQELHPPILGMLEIHGGQFKIEIYIYFQGTLDQRSASKRPTTISSNYQNLPKSTVIPLIPYKARERTVLLVELLSIHSK